MNLIHGDPASMRAGAAALRLRAERLSGIVVRVDGSADALPYSGPAADAFRSAVEAHSAEGRAVCARMLALADTLVRQAGLVEAEAQRGTYGSASYM